MRRILVESDYAAVWRELLDGISLYVREGHAAWELHCISTEEFVPALADRPDGALAILQRSQQQILEQIQRYRIPAVNMFRDVSPGLPSVLSDHEAIGRAAADYFLSRGFRQFAFLGPDRDWSHARAAGFRGQLRRAGRSLFDVDPVISVKSYRTVADRPTLRRLERWLERLPHPVAVLAGADFVARALLQACRNARRKVPEEIAVLGVDNDVAICELAPVALSSIPQNLHRIGFEAARLLDGLITGRRRSRGPVLIPPREVVVRRSTDVYAFDDPRVSTVMQLIHRRSPGNLAGAAAGAGGIVTMKDILRQVPVSRQWLDRRFKELVGRTPSEEIRRARLQSAQSMLADTLLPIGEISRRCGFGHAENLARFFREATGTSPRQFRLRHHR